MKNKNLFKKVLLIFILVCLSFIATACDYESIINGGNPKPPHYSAPDNKPTTPPIVEPKDDFPEIPVHTQNKKITDQEALGHNFFSSKNNYFNIVSRTRYVDLKKNKKIYIRYDENLDTDVKRELDVVINYLEKVLGFNSSYKIDYNKGKPGIGDIFVFDTIYIRNPNSKVKDTFKDTRVLGVTHRSNSGSPVVYINKNSHKETVNGKNIRMARTILHEIMHGFGFDHTLEPLDVMSSMQVSLTLNGSGSYYYRDPRTKTNIVVNDYFFFSENEIGGIIQLLAPNNTYEEKVRFYKNAGGKIPNFSKLFDAMKSNFLIDTRAKSVPEKSPDILLTNQIVSMKDKTNKFELIINQNSISTYTAKLRDGTSFTGRSSIMRISGNNLTNQIILLTDFIYEGVSRDITLYAIREQDGKFYQRWKVYDNGVDLVFADNTANYFS